MGGMTGPRSTSKVRVSAVVLVFMSIALLACGTIWVSEASERGTAFIRRPAFAGSFYPGDKKTLAKVIDMCYGNVDVRERVSSSPVGIIVPHAGYQYSGPVAAHGYDQIKGKPYKTVILLGSSHRARFKGIAVDTAAAWETPLGRVSVNGEISRAIAAKCPSVKPDPAAFREEHSLEVQLPFLQTALRNFDIVPLLTGFLDHDACRSLSLVLASLLKGKEGEILIVVSTDLSHYHSYGQAREMDRLALTEIGALDSNGLFENVRKGKCELCAVDAVLTFLYTAKGLGAKGRVLRYDNSGDVTGDRSRVVGYGSVVFTVPHDRLSLDRTQQALLLSIARKAMEASVLRKSPRPTAPEDPGLTDLRGAFVTLTRTGALRGCVGYIKPVRPLYEAVSEMAVAASRDDPRFRPVSREELGEIRIEISVLSPLEAVHNPQDIRVGTHGLLIARGGSSGLLLPQVAVEHNWTREEFLSNTCRKAGLPPLAWKEKGTAIYSFTAQVFSE